VLSEIFFQIGFKSYARKPVVFFSEESVCMILPRDAVARCVSVCPSVTRWYSVETVTHVPKVFFTSGIDTPFQFVTVKRYSNIPTETPVTEASNARGYENRDFPPISCFISETIQDKVIVTMECE